MRRLGGISIVAGLAALLSLGAAAAPAPQAARPGPDPLAMSPAEIAALQHLSDRQAELDRRAAEINERAVLLDAVEKRIDEKIARLSALLDRQSQIDDERGKRLAKIYQAMRPEDAARLLSTLDLGLAVDVLAEMRAPSAAPVLAVMEPGRARAATLALAERRDAKALAEAAAPASGEQ